MDTTYRLTQTGPEVQQALDQVAPIEAAIAALNEDKVDKEEGKGLSHNDFTDADKQKLADLPTEATLNQELATKQNVIDDLQSIRSGAAAGAQAAPQATTYTKTEVDALTADFITRTVNNLTNYYLKTETYTQAEVQQLIAAVKQFRYQSVAELPTAGADTMGIVYLVPSSNPKTQNVKDEFITVSTTNEQQVTTYAWEQIGSTTVDLSGYYTSAQTDAAITAALNTALASYSTTAQMNSAIAAALAPYYTKTEIDALLAGKQDVISDLSTIRSGAASGATAVQPAALTAEETRAKAAEKANADDIDALEALVPSGASALNQLADKQFVNSSVATNTATFRGTYNEVSDLALTTAATRQDIATALAGTIQAADNNDYCFVQIPTSTATPNEIARVERFKFNGSAWAYEYTLNNSGFTAEQWAALNSGIDATDVNKLNALPSKPVSTEAEQGLTDTEKSNARTNIGAVTATDNVASATKLQTPRKIYGNNFDGTEDVDGNLKMNGVLSGARGEVRSIEQIVNDRISVFSCNLSVDVIDANNIRLAVNDGQRAILQAVNTAVYTAEHVYMFVVYNISATNSGYVKFGLSDLASWGVEGTANVSTNAHNIAVIVRATDTYSGGYIYIDTAYGLFGDVIIGNMIALDLTAIFGAGNEPSTPEEFARKLGYASIDDVPYIPYTATPIPLNDAMAVGGDLIIREKIYSLVRPLNINGIVFTDETLSGLSELFATGSGDIDIADKNGNVVIRSENGHLITRLFQSEKTANYCFPVSEATWQTIGDSITWYDDHPNASLSKGYQTYVREKMKFTSISNIGVNASTAITWANNYLTSISAHDIYTIYVGVNDWGNNTQLGTLADYIAYSSGTASTFYAAYKAIVKKIQSVNQNALILTVTPRHSYDFNGFLPATSETANSAGVKLSDIANAIIEISRYEGFPVVDLFYESGLTDANVAAYSIDSALHPNDAGMNLIANMIIEKFKKYYI